MAIYELTLDNGDTIPYYQEPEVGRTFELWDEFEGGWVWYQVTDDSHAMSIDVTYPDEGEER